MSKSNGTTSKNGRLPNGRFAPGNTLSVGNAGGGRPKAQRRFVELVKSTVDEDAWLAIVRNAVAEAQGRVPGANVDAARRWLSRYVASEELTRYLTADEIREEMGPFGGGGF